MYRVLLADDEQIECRFLRKIISIKNDSYEVVGEAYNGEEAWNLIQSLRPDIAILDITMPLMTGLDVARKARDQYPDMILILNSAYQEFEYAQQAISYGINAYLVKPAEPEQLFSVLDSCVRKNSMKFSPQQTLGFTPDEAYPFKELDELLAAIESDDSDRTEKAIRTFLQFFRDRKESYHLFSLFILNTIFSIRHSLRKRRIPDEIMQLFADQVYLTKINNSHYWNEVLLYLDEYFSRLRLVLKCVQGTSPVQDNSLTIVKEYIDVHYKERITLDELSKLAHLSSAYLSRTFHQEYGMTIRDYLALCRLNHAVDLLHTTGSSIQQISDASGFSSVAHFYSICKKHIGLSPAEIRSEHVTEQEAEHED